MTGYASICSQCVAGIPFHVKNPYCLQCDLDFCDACQKKHAATWPEHNIYNCAVVPFTGSGGAPVERECKLCANIVHGYFECDTSGCQLVLCYTCFHSVRKEDKLHDHSDWTMTSLPHASLTDIDSTQCGSCRRGQTLVHCSRCLTGLRDGGTTFECRDCTKEYGDSFVQLCGLCHDEVSTSAKNEDHRWVSFKHTIVTDADDENMLALKCLDCERTYKDWTEQLIIRHAHSRWEIQRGTLKAQDLRGNTCRGCPRRCMRMPQNTNRKQLEMGCNWCWEPMYDRPGLQMSYCGQCGFFCCQDCEERADHPHRLITLNMIQRQAPSDFWKTCIRGEQNDRSCDHCGENFMSRITRYIRCATCKDCDFCETCVTETNADYSAHTCSGNSPMKVWDHVDVDGVTPEWMEAQMAKVTAEQKRLQEQEEHRAAAATRRTFAMPSRKPVAGQAAPAPAPQPRSIPIRAAPPSLPPRPAVQPRRQQRGINNDTGRFLMSLATGVVRGLAQVNQQQQAINNLNFGGGGGGGFDLTGQQIFTAGLQQSTWTSVSDAANAPIQ